MPRPTINAMVAEVLLMWSQLSQEQKDEWGLLECQEEDELIKYHHDLGRNIRNGFDLWSYAWEPDLVDGVDMSPEHPDAISMEVIRELWFHLKEIEDEMNA